ncbi:MAG: hypothetical protein UT01_C0066G0002 [Candidatus Daviesbacteria bacterium GW2011_GWA1_38_7]|nr:MAG: hypothetical protein UT01_C0066G0002 [Candidatus Daviesbacteria bacterium GW2011_GWA1_38_7]
METQTRERANFYSPKITIPSAETGGTYFDRAKSRLNRMKDRGLVNPSLVAFDLASQTYNIQEGKSWHSQELRDINGNLELGWWNGGEWISEADSWTVPVVDNNRPHWAKDRALKDTQSTLDFQNMLRNASVGASFFDLSPAPFDAPIHEKESLGFGTQSFLRVYVFKQDASGNFFLDSFARRLEVNKEGVSELFYRLTGERVKTEDTLGQVRLMNFDFSRLQQMASDVNAEFTNGVNIEDGELKNSDEDLFKFMSYLDKWNYGIYQLMKNPLASSRRRRIEELFHGVEMCFLDLILGKEGEMDIEAIKEIDPQFEFDVNYYGFSDRLNAQNRQMEQLMLYTRVRTYKAGFGCDGVGSGFGSIQEMISGSVQVTQMMLMVNADLTSRGSTRSGGKNLLETKTSEQVVYKFRQEHEFKCKECHHTKETGQCGFCEGCAAVFDAQMMSAAH